MQAQSEDNGISSALYRRPPLPLPPPSRPSLTLAVHHRLAGWGIVLGGIAAIVSRMSKMAASHTQ